MSNEPAVPAFFESSTPWVTKFARLRANLVTYKTAELETRGCP